MELNLTIKKKWFDMITSGVKKEEYREIKPYWVKRLKLRVGYRDFDTILFRNGYQKTSPSVRVDCLGIHQGKANPKWSDNTKGYFFVIKLGAILKESERG